jgi:hypothetical protein
MKQNSHSRLLLQGVRASGSKSGIDAKKGAAKFERPGLSGKLIEENTAEATSANSAAWDLK